MKWGTSVVLQIGTNMACFIKTENNSAEGILNLLEFSHIVFIHTIKLGIAVVNSTTDHWVGQQGCSLHTEKFTNGSIL